MASKAIKGLTIEIGGDTTKLGKALEAVEKQTQSLSSELGQINKLLKVDPGNLDLLAQKQKVLAEAVSNTSKKLETLREAEAQVQKQFERGEVSEDQVRALQREIIATTKKLEGYEKAAEETADAIKELGDRSDSAESDLNDTKKGADKAADSLEEVAESADEADDKLDDMADSADKAGDSSDGLGAKLGGLVKGGLAALAAGLTAAVGALVASAEASREYRTEMGKLNTAFTTAGHSSEAAKETYKALQGVLGETDQAVEAANHLAKLTDNEKDLQTWTKICTGVYGTFGASLPIEGLTEAANETAKTGALTGSLADALNWAGVNEDDFQAQLDACSNEQERQALIMDTLNGLYSDAADAYRETNAEVIRANQANEAWADSMAEIGGVIEPILTDIKLIGASLLSDLVPGIKQVAEGIRGLLNGNEGAADELGGSIAGIFETLLDKITTALPAVAEVGASLITTLAESLLDQLPAITRTLLQVVSQAITSLGKKLPSLLNTLVDSIFGILTNFAEYLPDVIQAVSDLLVGVAEALPGLVENIASWIPELIDTLMYALETSLPSILTAIQTLLSAVIEQLPVILPAILEGIVSLVTMIIDQLPVLIPIIVEVVTSLINMLAEQLPVLIPQLVTLLVGLIKTITKQLPVIMPMVIDAVIEIVMAIVDALPEILLALTDALPEILQAVLEAIFTVFVNLPAWFGQLFEGAVEIIFSVFGSIGEWFAGIWDNIANAFSGTGDFFSGIFAGAAQGIQDAWNGVTSFFSGIWDGIKNAFGKVGEFFKDIFSKAWNAVLDVFSAGGKVFNGIKDGILDVFKKVVNALIDGINTVVAIPFNGLNGILDTLQNLSFLGVSPFSWITWRAPVPQIPKLATGGVLERGQMGLLEGDGAEAVVPLEKNTAWIKRVAQEFMEQVTSSAGAMASRSAEAVGVAGSAASGGGMLDKLDRILAALERGQILTIDGQTLVGATSGHMDSALGQRRELIARGAY